MVAKPVLSWIRGARTLVVEKARILVPYVVPEQRGTTDFRSRPTVL